MKVFLQRFLAPVFLLATMLAGTNSFAQSSSKEEAKTVSINKDLLAARWTAGDADITFHKDGTSQIIVNNRTCPGTWVVEGKTLTVSPKKLMWNKEDPCSKTRVYEVTSLKANSLELVETAGKAELHLKKQK
jgi:hypothetical protein